MSDEREKAMTTDSPRVWNQACSIVKSEIGAAAWGRWIEPLSFRGLAAEIARFDAPTEFAADWVRRHYAEEITGALNEAGGRCAQIVVSAGAQQAAAESAHPAPQVSAMAGVTTGPQTGAGMADTALRSAPLERRFTFDQFIVGRPNELAHAAARRVAEDDSVVYNPVFLHGGVGLGKTHLMHAISWRIAERTPHRKVLYLSAEQFMYRFIQAIKKDNTIAFKEQFRSVDVLMVDDVQFIAGKNSTQVEFFHTFNALIDSGKQIVISGDRAPGDIEHLEERIRSRLQWGLVVDIHPTDYELRLGILQAKAEAALEREPSVRFDPKVLEFLAHRISSNVRVLEGALTRLFAYASLVGREITLDMAQECLADLLRASDRKVTIEEIMRKVADHYNLRLSDMTSARRARAVARPRQMAMFLAKTLTSKSLPEIGRKFGGRDHTTVMHAVKRIESLSDTDSQIAEDVELLRRMLEA
ncbi:MAG: chromosomal replication initiator protein DnaA [Pikeienuella sp.]